MSSATGLGGVAGDGAAGAAESVVERNGGGKRGEACDETDAQVLKGACSVTFEGEDVLAGLEDRFDALADRGEVGASAGFVFASRSGDRGVEVGEFGFEVFAAEVLVADQDQHLAGLAVAARDHLQADKFLVDLWRGQRERPWCAVQGEQGVQPEAPEEPGMAGTVAVVGGVGERVRGARAAATLNRLKRADTLDRRRVDEQQRVVEAGAVARELADQALDHPGQAQPALVKRGPLRQLREQVRQTSGRDREEPGIGRDPHDRLRDRERDDLCVEDSSSGVLPLFGQEIVHRAINSDQQQIEVGVHRGPPQGRRSVQDTVDFDLPAYVPFPNPTRPPHRPWHYSSRRKTRFSLRAREGCANCDPTPQTSSTPRYPY